MCVQRFPVARTEGKQNGKKPQIHMSVGFCCVAKHKEGLIKDLYFIFWFIAGGFGEIFLVMIAPLFLHLSNE